MLLLLKADIAILNHRRPYPIPLLFVHGHLGSPHQMRSMASETSREVIRRYKAASSTTTTSNIEDQWDLWWIDWYAVNFNAEPSAFEPHLVTEQARFVTACLKYLSAEHDTTTSSPLLLVGYSMGGLVVDAALEELIHTPGDSSQLDTTKDIIQRLALVLTLGSPRHHLPSFLTSSTRTISSRTTNFSSSSFASSINFLPPSVHILAGPGDLMIPGLSSWASIWKTNKKATLGTFPSATSTADAKESGNTAPVVLPLPVQVDMDDVPGVWCTASHKGMISCNQLVRQTVPLLIDAAARRRKEKVEEKRSGRDAAVRAAAGRAAISTGKAAALKMTTSLLKGMPETIIHTEILLNEIKDGLLGEEKLKTTSSNSIARCGSSSFNENKFIFTQQLQRRKEQQNHCYIWNAEEEFYKNTMKNGFFFLLMSGLAPEAEFKVLAEFPKDRKEVDVSALARPLPGMVYGYPSATETTFK